MLHMILYNSWLYLNVALRSKAEQYILFFQHSVQILAIGIQRGGRLAPSHSPLSMSHASRHIESGKQKSRTGPICKISEKHSKFVTNYHIHQLIQ